MPIRKISLLSIALFFSCVLSAHAAKLTDSQNRALDTAQAEVARCQRLIHELSDMRVQEYRKAKTKEELNGISARYDALLDNEAGELRAANEVLAQIKAEISGNSTEDKEDVDEDEGLVITELPDKATNDGTVLQYLRLRANDEQ